MTTKSQNQQAPVNAVEPKDVSFPCTVISVGTTRYTKSNKKQFIICGVRVTTPDGDITTTAMRDVTDENGVEKALPEVNAIGSVYLRRREDNGQITLNLSLGTSAINEEAFGKFI